MGKTYKKIIKNKYEKKKLKKLKDKFRPLNFEEENDYEHEEEVSELLDKDARVSS